MIPWELLDRSPIPGEEQELSLYRRGEEYVIRLGTLELMNSRLHFSEEELARMACERAPENPRILIGGLGMGFTLQSALRNVGPLAKILVVELVSAVIKWNKTSLGHLAEHPLKDPRVSVVRENVASTIKSRPGYYDVILLDVDNGPQGLTSRGNDSLYSRFGLRSIFAALKPGGTLGVWSVSGDAPFRERLIKVGFEVEEHRVFARPGKKGRRHTIWIAAKP